MVPERKEGEEVVSRWESLLQGTERSGGSFKLGLNFSGFLGSGRGSVWSRLMSSGRLSTPRDSAKVNSIIVNNENIRSVTRDLKNVGVE